MLCPEPWHAIRSEAILDPCATPVFQFFGVAGRVEGENGSYKKVRK
ncbi:MAG: hypothetical protein V3R57_04075 [Candidatus Bathyarchaeia archaeon]